MSLLFAAVRRLFLIPENEKMGVHFFVSAWVRIQILLEEAIDKCISLSVYCFLSSIQVQLTIGLMLGELHCPTFVGFYLQDLRNQHLEETIHPQKTLK